MIRLLLFLIFFTLTALIAFTQVTALPLNEQRYGDSLQKLLDGKIPDSTRANAGFLLSNFWYRKDSVKGASYLEQASHLSAGNSFQQSVYYFYLANLQSLNNIELAESSYIKADSLLQRFKSKEAYNFRSRVWHNYAVQQQRKDDHELFADILLNKAIPFAEKSGDSVYLGKNFFDLGLAFKNTMQYPKAEEYSLKALDIFRKINAPKDQLINVYNTISENYILQNNISQAGIMLDSASALLSPYPESQYFLDFYASQGMYFTVQSKFSQAHNSIDKGIALAQKLGLESNEQRLLLQKFYAFFYQKNFEKAKNVLLNLMQKQPFIVSLNNRLQVYNGMAEIYASMGKKNLAYGWLKRYSQLSDSVASVNLQSRINGIELKYKNKEIQKQITVLQAEKDKAALHLKNRRLINWLLSGITGFLVIMSAFLWLYYRNTKKLAVQKETNYQQQLKEAEQKRQIQFAEALLQGETRERKRLAGDLHDGLGGLLSGIKINLSSAVNNNPESGINSEISKVILQLDNSVNELRRIARNMMPESLTSLGLEPALKDMCNSFSSETMFVTLQVFSIDAALPEDIQAGIYRIVQELLTNAVRHAGASQILIQCSQNKNSFFITVEDNGKGFNTGAINSQNGMGLANVQSRVGYLCGKMDITSAPGEGTTINIEFDVTEKRKN